MVINVNTLDNVSSGKAKNYSRALGSSSHANPKGMVVCKLLSDRTYVITATCEGYYK